MFRPVSATQEPLWFLAQLEPESSDYNMAHAFRLRGKVDRAALEAAFRDVARRHEAIRCTFHSDGGKPVAQVSSKVDFTLDDIDLRDRGLDAHGLEMRERLHEWMLRPYDLSSDLLLRGALFRLGDDEYVLAAGMHHIAADGWSREVLNRDLSAFYNARFAGTPPPGPLAVQYDDFARRQRERLSGESYAGQLAFWRDRLRGSSPASLPTDRPRPARVDATGGSVDAHVPAALKSALSQLGRSEKASLFVVMLAALHLLLHRMTGEEDLAVGSSVATRRFPHADTLIGFLVNTIVFRTDVSGDPTFQELLARTVASARGSLVHRDMPFGRLTAELRPAREPGRNPFFDVLINYPNFPETPVALEGVAAEPVRVDEPAHFDAAFRLIPAGDGLTLRLTYQTALFDEGRMQRVIDQYRDLLDQILADPDRPLSAYAVATKELLPATALSEEDARKLAEWNRAELDYPRDETLVGLFERQAERTPDAPAVTFEERTLSYRELNRDADRLAARLRSHGVGRGSFVGVHLPRNEAAITALVGVMKAGAAYVPLDVKSPWPRLQGLIEEAGLAAIVSADPWAQTLEAPSCPVLLPSDEEESAPVEGAQQAGPCDACYLIFTSGSTGKPKGVVIEHQAAVNYVWGVSERLGLGELDSFALLQPLTVDSSVTTIYAALLFGGRLDVISEDAALDAPSLARLFERTPIDYLKIAPSHLEALHGAGGEAVMPRRVLICGGEALSWDAARRLRGLAPECRLYNHYGPTEATVGASAFPVLDERGEGPVVPIGRPLPNMRAYVLDERRRRVPVGVEGELWLGGDSIARGYLNRPDLTAEAFVEVELDGGGERLYRTGDRARFLSSGDIEFLGRGDDQVKIRGMRIEPGEIEAAARRHPAVREAAVLAVSDSSGAARLAVYVVPETGQAPDEKSLAEFLREQLPPHFVPAAYAVLDELPRTSHGKLDRQALARIAPLEQSGSRKIVEPRDEVERRLVRLWSECLGREAVSVDESFFDLGGHSLLAVSLLAAVSREFDRTLPLSVFIEAPTAAAMAEVLRGESEESEWTSLVPMQPKGERRPFYCVHAAGGSVLFYADLARNLAPDQPVYALQPAGLRDASKAHSDLREMAGAYVAEIRRLQPRGPYSLGGYCSGAYVALEMARQLEEAGEEIGALVVFDTDGSWRSNPGGLAWHLEALGQLDAAGRVGYLRERVRFRSDRMLGAAITRLERRYRRDGRRLSEAWTRRYTEERTREAAAGWTPRPIRGPLIYFEGEDGVRRDPAPFWRGLVGEMETESLPGDGASLFTPPNVEELARRLRRRLTAIAAPAR